MICYIVLFVNNIYQYYLYRNKFYKYNSSDNMLQNQVLMMMLSDQ